METERELGLRHGGETTGKVRLLVADDNPHVLEEIRNLLAPDFDVVKTVTDGRSLIKAAEELRPDVIVTDIRMPQPGGIEAARAILAGGFCRAIVALSIYRDSLLAEMVFEAGLLGYVIKEAAGDDLIRAIDLALRGKRFASADLHVTPPE